MNPTKDKNATGRWGEDLAARMLAGQGYKILGTRVQLDARDEIDVVARDGEALVFVEVKTRKTDQFGRPADFVDRAKRHSLSRAAVRYLKRLKLPPVNFRFDVVEVTGAIGCEDPKINHIQNAFNLDRIYFVP